MLIDEYDLEVESVPCEPGSEECAAILRLRTDIRAVLPYLNRTLRGARYIAQGPALMWKKGGRNIAFWPYKIAIGHLEDRVQAEKVARGLVDLVNRTWQRRAEIEPNHEERRRPAPLEIYNLLPRTNCRACGQPTCYTFALRLTLGQAKLADCVPLGEPDCASQLEQLSSLLPDGMPAVGP